MACKSIACLVKKYLPVIVVDKYLSRIFPSTPASAIMIFRKATFFNSVMVLYGSLTLNMWATTFGL